MAVSRRGLVWFVGTLLLAAFAFWAGSRRGHAPLAEEPSTWPSSPGARARGIMAKALAWSEIEKWDEARALFLELHELLPTDPVPAINLGVVAYRKGDVDAARRWLDGVEAKGYPTLQARIAYYRGILYYERASPEDELTAFLEAARLDPDEPAYAFALGQQYLRLRPLRLESVLENLERALTLWPRNARIAVEFALWASLSPDRNLRGRALDGLQRFVNAAKNKDIRTRFEQGRKEVLEREGATERVPPKLQAAFNLLRATPRYRTDANELEKRLKGNPMRSLTAWELRRRRAFLRPLVRYGSRGALKSPQLLGPFCPAPCRI